MWGDVSGTRQRAFFQSVCPASRPGVTGTGLIKWLGHSELKITDGRMESGSAQDNEIKQEPLWKLMRPLFIS